MLIRHWLQSLCREIVRAGSDGNRPFRIRRDSRWRDSSRSDSRFQGISQFRYNMARRIAARRRHWTARQRLS